MAYMSRQRSRDMGLTRQISIEETYSLATVARRKSSSEAARHDLRQRVGHAYMLEALEHAIRNSPPSSPKQPTAQPARSERHISWATLETPKREVQPVIDDYDYEYDDGEEDLGGLSLCRTSSRRP